MADSGGGLGTGGVDLGSFGQLEGHMPGLNALTTLATDIGPVLAERMVARKAAKDYNDQPAEHSIGTDRGNILKEEPSDWQGEI